MPLYFFPFLNHSLTKSCNIALGIYMIYKLRWTKIADSNSNELTALVRSMPFLLKPRPFPRNVCDEMKWKACIFQYEFKAHALLHVDIVWFFKIHNIHLLSKEKKACAKRLICGFQDKVYIIIPFCSFEWFLKTV